MNKLLGSIAENALYAVLRDCDMAIGAGIPTGVPEGEADEVTFCEVYTTKNGQVRAEIKLTVSQI